MSIVCVCVCAFVLSSVEASVLEQSVICVLRLCVRAATGGCGSGWTALCVLLRFLFHRHSFSGMPVA